MLKTKKNMLIRDKFLEGLVDIFYPPACPICLRPRPIVEGRRENICKICRKKAPYITGPSCFKCGKPLDNTDSEFCKDCLENPHVFKKSMAVFEYTDSISKSIYEFKYYNKREFGKVFASELVLRLEDEIRKFAPDVIVPVPISNERRKFRGFNQAEILAKNMAKDLNIPYDENLIYRVKNTIPMKKLSNTNRIKNLENAFQVSRNVVRYNKVIVVDDIYTTGATLDAITKELKRFKDLEVVGIVICVGQGF